MGDVTNHGIGSQFDPSTAKKSKDGFWRDNNNNLAKVSASDIERHTYCPLSWELAKKGNSGQGDAINSGKTKHAQIHERVSEFKIKQSQFKRHMIIWTWWFTVIIAIVIDSIAFMSIDDVALYPKDIAKYLAMWSLTVLLAGIIAVSIPWRDWLGFDVTLKQQKSELIQETKTLQPEWEPEGFEGGWFEAGKVETSLLFAAILLGIHSIALNGADNRKQAGFILIVLAMLWTLAASWQLQRALITENESELARKDVGLKQGTEVAYSDDEESAGLLIDNVTGIRGRPDQIVIIDGEFIPIEQKTGRVPKRPHTSHRRQVLAYIHLVEINTKRTTPYGILRYGNEDIHQVMWDDNAKKELFDEVKEIQRLMVIGGAKRNHERVGKCQNCSRKYACNESLAE
ncbi:MAG: Dna2/Cas4 domain-containing protein [Candidatus Poseidoniaceae archaeon]|nr:Dna2/Cas4 domain-containing protein [Candidatus Poseidoniaceae archaeon]MBL6896206.1 Dna2/Cas4 domain-containing protein [Candidatus Poseidoniaceae archaeon]MDA8545504.1 Dna2/Cas4 domain-containing protein [Candidatus Poseidoniales archaeon]